MPRVLAIDTTGDVCSLALTGPDTELTFHQSMPRQHARVILPEIQGLFDQAGWQPRDLDFVVYGRGPGSFTGIRIAAGVAQGVALGVDCGIVPVSTLETLAFEAGPATGNPTWVALDARMQELYFAKYAFDEAGLPELDGDEQLLKPADLVIPPGDVRLVGNGWTTDYGFSEDWQRCIARQGVTGNLPRALHAARLAIMQWQQDEQRLLPPETALPTYIRDNVTWDKPVKQ
ncbi:MAG: tRNA (adenosine(37)-N6)-threonylcarbamoyltransferase complex dimerization subunit type 1 TsaB [Saccharospirillum sp.]